MQIMLYPLTYPNSLSLDVLSSFFTKIVMLVPTEDLLCEIQSISEGRGIDIQAYCPVPLGERLSDVLQQFKQWTAWASSLGIGEGLHGQSFVALSAAQDETMQAIMERIKGDAGHDDLLMARFFLWIAHQADRTEDEVFKSFHALPAQETLFYDPLENQGDSTKTMLSFRIEPLSQIKKRFLSWAELAKLYLAGMNTSTLIPVGQDIGLKDLMDSAYEALFPGRIAQELLTFRLSGNDLASFKDSKEFQTLWMDFINKLSGLAACKQDIADVIKEINTASKEVLKISEGILGRDPKSITFTCTLYPGISWKDLLFYASGKGGDVRPQYKDDVCGISFFVF